ncbi:MAG: hypothetical protein JSV18_05690 [Candidatus Bathyarchaeota archaeon]|nr:MAG: hypothetical protein JSV18_05690 [Candidatus Bathyarchaeota archaeon]
MSEGEPLTPSKLAANFFGFILLALGLAITYFSVQADFGYVNPKIFAPVGILIALAGGLLAVAWED